MKKILYSLLIFVSIFFVVDKVSADYDDTKTIYLDLENTKVTTVLSNLEPKLTEILDYYKNNNPYNHELVIFIRNNGDIYLYLLPESFVSTMGTNYCSLYVANSSSAGRYSYGCRTSDIKIKSYTFNSSSDISQFKTDMITEYSSISDRSKGSHVTATTLGSKISFFDNISDFLSSYSFFGLPYYSTVPIYNYEPYTGYTYYNIKFGDLELPFRGYLEPSDNYFKQEEPEPYIFDEYIYDHIYSKMIFNFDLSILESRDHVFDLMLNNLSVENEINDGILYETERFEISYPYLEYETSTGLKDILYLKDYDDNEIKEKRKVFVGFYQERLPENVTSLKLIIPLYDTTEYQLLVQLVTWFPFEVSYETEEQMHSYYEYLDLSNKYGAMFIPKLVSNNSQITTYFLTRGIDTIYIYDTYDYKEAPIEIYEDVSDFTYSFSYDEQQHNLFFKTNTYSSFSTIYYDTRYFDYYIVDSKYSIGSITNPNTGENHYIDFSNTANVEVNFANIGDVFNFISDKIDSTGESYLLFKDSVSTFFNTMPTDIYILILTILAVILIGTALALGGWK